MVTLHSWDHRRRVQVAVKELEESTLVLLRPLTIADVAVSGTIFLRGQVHAEGPVLEDSLLSGARCPFER